MIEVSKKWLKDTIFQLESMDEEELKILSLLVRDELQRRDFYAKARIIRKDISVYRQTNHFFRVGRKAEKIVRL